MSLKVEFINPFLESTVNVLKTMAFIEPIPGKPYIKTGGGSTGDVSGIVGITGDAEGSLCITFSKSCILLIISKMFGEEQREINDEVKDAVGELTNVISGDSRRRLEGLGHHFLGAVPSVISGQGHEVKHITKGPVLSIPFSTPAGNFTVEVCFK
jgi:chemotaxis protein CheX